MTRVDYVSDNGSTYRLRMDASNATAAGNAAATVAVDLPKRTQPRYVLAQHPTSGRERRIVIADPTSALWTGGTTTISLPDFNAAMAATNYNIRGRIGERRLG
jgi:hypothetical protein